MPRTWNDKYIPSKADLNVKMLTNAEIGGIGKLQYRLLKFNKFKMEQISGENAFYTFPTYDNNENVKVIHMSGKELFISLYNLAKSIDSYDVKRPFSEQILEWCENVCTPYGLDNLQEYLDTEKNKKGKFVNLAKDRHFYFQFEIRDFMQNLNDLYSAAKFYFALMYAFDDVNTVPAYELLEEGKHFDQLPFFEYKKVPNRKKYPNIVPPKTKQEFIDIMRKAVNVDDSLLVEEFSVTSYDEYTMYLNKLIDVIPPLKMKLSYNPVSRRAVMIADVRSVFDIAWFTLARMISDDNTLADLGSEDDLKDGVVLYCPYCGEAFIRKGNHRRRYCTKVECQRARKNKNTIACRERKKASMGQNEKANENTTNPNQD